MFGWLKKILREMIAEEADLLKEELGNRTETEELSRIQGQIEAEVRSRITEALTAELKEELQQELKYEMTTMILELFADFKQQMTEEFKKDVTGEFKQQMAEELKDEFAELQEQILAVAKNHPPEMTTRQAAAPMFEELSASPETLVNIGPGLKKLLNDKNASVKRETVMQFVNQAAAKLDPAHSKSLTDYIIHNENSMQK